MTKEYNEAFFKLFQDLYLTLKKNHGEKRALSDFSEVMITGLRQAYGADKRGVSTEEFAMIVGKRDQTVGLEVSFKDVLSDSLIYQFHTDPFPGLKGEIASEQLDHTYMNFKVQYLLGEDWSYETTQHLWKGDKCTQHIIRKKIK